MFTIIDTKIIAAMARTLFLLAWSDDQEQNKGRGLQGEIDNLAPQKTPGDFYIAAAYLGGRIAQANSNSLFMLVRLALGYDLGRTLGQLEEGDKEKLTDEYIKRFGHCLAMMVTGTGVSWFDDHAKFDLRKPLVEWNFASVADEAYDSIYLDGEQGQNVRDELDSVESGMEAMSRDSDLESHLSSVACVLDVIGRKPDG